jgi:formiminotetrahydrofolate cyclodeaminase
MLKQSCGDFIDALASESPVPGGGGACAYAGALGMALGSMVGNLTLRNRKYADVREDVEALLNRSRALTERFKSLVNRDAEAFYPLSRIYGLPRNTEEERAAREAALQSALAAAAEPPLEIAECCVEALRLFEAYAEKGSRIAISDAGVGAILCKAALQGAKLNVLANTKLIKDEDVKKGIEARMRGLEAEGLKKADEIYQSVEDLLRGRAPSSFNTP